MASSDRDYPRRGSSHGSSSLLSAGWTADSRGGWAGLLVPLPALARLGLPVGPAASALPKGFSMGIKEGAAAAQTKPSRGLLVGLLMELPPRQPACEQGLGHDARDAVLGPA